MCEKREVYLVGIGPGGRKNLTAEAEAMLRECDAVIGSERMLRAVFSTAPAIPPQEDESEDVFLQNVFSCYKPEEIRVWLDTHEEFRQSAVVLSGDSGFYSGAKKLERELRKTGGYEVRILPGISSVSYLAARLHISWEDACLASVHGRKQNYIQMIAGSAKTFLLTGGKDSGEEICRKLNYYGLGEVSVSIGKNLSYETEEIVEKRAEELVPEDLEGLCTVLVQNPAPVFWAGRSVPDAEWIRGSVPMTKEEVRTVSIGKLHLQEYAVLYDIGAGTGSVGISAALLSETIRVYAIEKNPEAIRLIEQNKQKFRTDWVQTVEGEAPGVLEGLEKPTHVFIGGSAGNLPEILSCVRQKNPDARIVLNAASLETIKEAMEAVEQGLLHDPEILQISVAKARELGNYHMMTGQNPVYIISQ